MLERWSISPLPSKTDPRRHALWLKADLSDIQGIIRKFGGMCGRPQKERKRPEFNFFLYLREATPAKIQSLEKYIASSNPSAFKQASVSTAHGDAADSSVAPGLSISEGNPVASRESTATVERLTPIFSPDNVPGNTGAPFPPEATPLPQGPLGIAPVAPVERESPAGPPQFDPLREIRDVQQPPASIAPNLTPASESQINPPIPMFSNSSDPGNLSKAAPPASGQAVGSVLTSDGLWGARCPLDPLFSFESLTVGPYNRFAHAASMAVVSNPGMIYNPLLLHGVPGAGKSHILMSIAHSLQHRSTEGPVFFTTGPRLARAVRNAIAAGKISDFEDFIKTSRALIIDDVHIMEISEQNQAGLITILNHYFNNVKPVIMASVYPPQALGSMEEALRFQISSGWSVEMKPPSIEIQKNVVNLALARAGFNATEEAVAAVLEMFKTNHYAFSRRLRHLKALAAIHASHQSQPDLADLVRVVRSLEAAAPAAMTDDEIRALGSRASPPPAGGPNAWSLGIFYPKGLDKISNHIMAGILDAAAKNGVPVQWRLAVEQEYDLEQISALPFLISDAAEKAQAQAILVLGPNSKSGVANREGEIFHALERILNAINVQVGWISYDRVQDPGSYFQALLDIFPLR